MVSDSVGDFIIRLKNAGAVKKAIVSVPYSAFKLAIAEKLQQAGFIEHIEKKGKKVRKTLDIALKYDESGAPAIHGVRRVSKPGRRLYRTAPHIVSVHFGRGLLLLSTPKGVLTNKEARKERVGGEALFEIW